MVDDRQRFISTWQEPLLAVASVRATAADRAAAIAPERARWLVGELHGDTSRDVLLTLYQLAGGTAQAVNLSAGFLASAVEAAVDEGRLLFVTEGEGDGARGQTAPASGVRETPDEKLARQAMANRIDIPFEGQRLRVMSFTRFRTGAARSVSRRPL